MAISTHPHLISYRIVTEEGEDLGQVTVEWVDDKPVIFRISLLGKELSIKYEYLNEFRKVACLFQDVKSETFSAKIQEDLVKVIYEGRELSYPIKYKGLLNEALYGINLHALSVKDSVGHTLRLRNQAKQLEVCNEALRIKNRELDALHYVWCSGGCGGGIHRWNKQEVTEELVKTAEASVWRLRTWFENYKFSSRTDDEKRNFFRFKYHVRQLIGRLYWWLVK